MILKNIVWKYVWVFFVVLFVHIFMLSFLLVKYFANFFVIFCMFLKFCYNSYLIDFGVIFFGSVFLINISYYHFFFYFSENAKHFR